MSNFLNNILKIKEELKVSKAFSRDDLFEECVNKKLENVVKIYNRELDEGSDFLLTKNPESVLKAINKMQKVKDREVLKGYLNSCPTSKKEVEDND